MHSYLCSHHPIQSKKLEDNLGIDNVPSNKQCCLYSGSLATLYVLLFYISLQELLLSVLDTEYTPSQEWWLQWLHSASTIGLSWLQLLVQDREPQVNQLFLPNERLRDT